MEILKMYPETLADDKRLMYALTRGQTVSVKNVDPAQVLTPEAFIMYMDVNAKGETNEVLAVKTKEGINFSTISRPFKEEFFIIHDLMVGEEYSIHVVKGTAKNGREYVTCTMEV